MAGETTALAANAALNYYDIMGSGCELIPFDLTFSTIQNELNDIMQAGYIGINTRVYAVGWYPTDLDTNGTPTVLHKVTVGGVDIVTGLNGGQTGTPQWVPVSVFTTASTNPTLVQVQTTTAAATAAAGTAKLVLLAQKINLP